MGFLICGFYQCDHQYSHIVINIVIMQSSIFLFLPCSRDLRKMKSILMIIFLQLVVERNHHPQLHICLAICFEIPHQNTPQDVLSTPTKSKKPSFCGSSLVQETCSRTWWFETMDPTIPKVESQPIIHVGWCDSSFEQNQKCQTKNATVCHLQKSNMLFYIILMYSSTYMKFFALSCALSSDLCLIMFNQRW